MSKWGWAIRLGGYAGAPFTGGLSIPAAQVAAGAVEKKQHANDVPGGGGNTAAGSKHPEDPYTNLLQQYSQQANRQGQQLTGMGTEALAPVLNYFRQLTGSDPGALMDATRADRGKVMDQYDSARRSIANFGPRGGGTTAALAQSRFDQASSLADITSNARRSAVAGQSEIGTALTGLGMTAHDLASRDLGTIINSVLAREGFNVQQRGQNMQMAGDIAETLGTLIGIYLGRDQGGGSSQPPGVTGGILG